MIEQQIKLIDGKTYEFELNTRLYLGFYIKHRNSFFTNIPRGNKICGLSQASNIKPLVVIE